MSLLNELRQMAWTSRTFAGEVKGTEAIVINPIRVNEARALFDQMREPTEWDIELLTILGYRMYDHFRKPQRVFLDGDDMIPVWINDMAMSSVNFKAVTDHRVVKARLDAIDHLTVNRIRNEIKARTEAGVYQGELDEKLAEAETITFRERFLERAQRNKQPKAYEAAKQAEWLIISNVLKEPDTLTLHYSWIDYSSGIKKSDKERVRQGFSVYFCYEESERSDAYIRIYAQQAVNRGWNVKDWYIFDSEPKPFGPRLRLEQGELFTHTRHKKAAPKTEPSHSAADIKKAKDKVRKLLALANTAANPSEAESALAREMAQRIMEQYGFKASQL